MTEIINDVNSDSSPEEVAVEKVEDSPINSEVEKTPADSAPKPEEKVVPYERFKKVNDELSQLKKQPVKVVNKSLDVEDYIDISASLEGLDQKEKAYLAREHKLTGTPLTEIRKNEDFLLWQSAYRAKVEKEQSALAPSNRQNETDRPRSLDDTLNGASLEEKEKILIEKGLYRPPRGQAGRSKIGV